MNPHQFNRAIARRDFNEIRCHDEPPFEEIELEEPDDGEPDFSAPPAPVGSEEEWDDYFGDEDE